MLKPYLVEIVRRAPDGGYLFRASIVMATDDKDVWERQEAKELVLQFRCTLISAKDWNLFTLMCERYLES